MGLVCFHAEWMEPSKRVVLEENDHSKAGTMHQSRDRCMRTTLTNEHSLLLPQTGKFSVCHRWFSSDSGIPPLPPNPLLQPNASQQFNTQTCLGCKNPAISKAAARDSNYQAQLRSFLGTYHLPIVGDYVGGPRGNNNHQVVEDPNSNGVQRVLQSPQILFETARSRSCSTEREPAASSGESQG